MRALDRSRTRLGATTRLTPATLAAAPALGIVVALAGPWLAACPDARGISARQPGDGGLAADHATVEDATALDRLSPDAAVPPDAVAPVDVAIADLGRADTVAVPDRAGFDQNAATDVAPVDTQADPDAAVAPCASSACTDPHRTVCVSDGGGPICLCDDGYLDYGDGACRPADPCAGDPCTEPNRTRCENQLGVAACLCDDGYLDQGGSCLPAVSCDPNPCQVAHRARCAVVGGAVECSCDDGYVDDGAGGCVPLSGSACDPNPCSAPARSVCSAVNGLAVCRCDPGFEEDGLGGCAALTTDPCASASCGTGVSGRVTHGGAPLPGLVVSAYDGACPLAGFVASTFTDDDGYYALTGLGASAALYVRAGQGADARWYTAGGGTATCLAREAVTVVADQTTLGVDVVYPAGGAIGGRVTAGGVGLGPGLQLQFYRQLCGAGALAVEVLTDADGNYLARGLPVGAYHVQACPACQAGFEQHAARWWRPGNGTADCALAEPVAVLAHSLTPAIDLDLEPPASIAGRLTLDGDPVSGVLVHAYDDTCAAGHLTGAAFSASDGSYHLDELPAGPHYLETRMRNQASPRLADAWWTAAGGSPDCSLAEVTTVASGASATGRHFTLARGGSVSGQVTASGVGVAGMYVWAHVADCARSDERAWFQPALTDGDGAYRIVALPAGELRIYLSAQDAHPGVRGWYDGSTGVASCLSSTTVHVIDATDTGGVDLAF